MTALILTNNHEETAPNIGGALTSFDDPVSSHIGDGNGLDDQLSATTSPSSSASNAAITNSTLPGSSFVNLSNLHISKTVDGSGDVPSILMASPTGMHHQGLRLSSQVFSPKAVSSYHTLLNLLEKQRDTVGSVSMTSSSSNGAADSAATSEPSSISSTPESSLPGSPTRSASVPCLHTAVKECLLASASTTVSLPPSRLGSSLGCKRRKRIPLRSPRSSFDSTDIPGIVFTFQSSPVLKVLHLPMDYTTSNHQSCGGSNNSFLGSSAAAVSPTAYSTSASGLNHSFGVEADHTLSDGAFSDDEYDGSFHGSGGGSVSAGRPARAAATASSSTGPKDPNHHVTHHRRPSSKKPPLNARVCASCNVSKTPYWREAWDPYIVLCNACGLRFSKFKKRCVKCNYVPRKDDKGGRCCPICSGDWA